MSDSSSIHTSCMAVMVAAQASGQGKTLISCALIRQFQQQGKRVRAIKCGPDFIDGSWLAEASGAPVYNIDLGMCGEADVRQRLAAAAKEADVIVIESVMGLYDGAPSSAEIARLLQIPVLLVIDASAMAQTFSAVAHGLFSYQEGLRVAGVVANNVGGIGHAQLLKTALPEKYIWRGAMPNNTAFQLPERHLGLHSATEIPNLDQWFNQLASAWLMPSEEAWPSVVFDESTKRPLPPLLKGKTIAIANDEAFRFIYPANVDCLKEMGAECVYFSPLHDEAVPEADAVWLPGGYPELYLALLSQHKTMRQSLHQLFEQGVPIYAECGGLLAAGETLNGVPMFGLLSGHGKLSSTLQGLGTQVLDDHGRALRGHTFHYGQFETTLKPWRQTHPLKADGFSKGEAVFRQGALTASFFHAYFPSNPEVAAEFFLP